MDDKPQAKYTGPYEWTTRMFLEYFHPAHAWHTITGLYPRVSKKFVFNCSCGEKLEVSDDTLMAAKTSYLWAKKVLFNVPPAETN